MLILFVQTLSAAAAAYRGKMKKTRAPANNMKASGERRRKKEVRDVIMHLVPVCRWLLGRRVFSFYYLSTIQRWVGGRGRAITFSVGGMYIIKDAGHGQLLPPPPPPFASRLYK
jgi:hypothetical protein